MSEQSPSPWEPQADGTYLPSRDLVNKVRENPAKYPNAVQDFAIMSGKSLEETRQLIDQDGWNVWRPVKDLTQGVTSATGMILENTGKTIGVDGLTQAGEAVRGFADGIDPKYETEKSWGEKATEFVGQIAPAVAAGVATGGLGGAVVGSAVGVGSFEPEDNLVNVLEQVAPEFTPDALVVQEDDPHALKMLKAFAVDLTLGAAVSAGVGAVGKALSKIKNGMPAEEAAQVLQDLQTAVDEVPVVTAGDTVAQVADELPAIDDVAQASIEGLSPSAARLAEETTEQAVKMADDVPAAPEVTQKVLSKDRDGELAANLHRVGREDALDGLPVVPVAKVKAFKETVFAPVDVALRRISLTNTGRKAAVQSFREEGIKNLSDHSELVFQSLHKREMDQVIHLLKHGAKTNASLGKDVLPLYRQSMLRSVIAELDADYDRVLKYIRENPAVSTKDAWVKFNQRISKAQVELGELWREEGSIWGYTGHLRKGNKFGDIDLDALEPNRLEILDELKASGLDLKATKSEFMVGKVLEAEQYGLDVVQLTKLFEEAFEEFDKLREGAIHSIGKSHLGAMTKTERHAIQESNLKLFQDLHIAALLGQPSTSALEIMSNTISNIILPITRETLGGKGARGLGRARAELAGYLAGFSRFKATFGLALKKGKGITTDFDIMDGSHAGKADYDRLVSEGKWGRYVALRLWKGTADISVASADASVALRAYGIAYADGLEMALKSGQQGKVAKTTAASYAQAKFSPDGLLVDASLKIEAQTGLWQNSFDTRYVSGAAAEKLDSLRQSPSPVVSTLARFTVPVWRTLVNIGGHASQTIIPPGMPTALRLAAKHTKAGETLVKSAKFLDDFTGANGARAQSAAVARQRMGMMAGGTIFALTETRDDIEITGPSKWGRWDEKMQRQQVYPPSSLIIGDTAVDLTRFLPFSAPLLLMGATKDMARSKSLKMNGGEYTTDEYEGMLAGSYVPAVGFTYLAMLSDAAALRGISDFTDAVMTAIQEGNTSGLSKFTKNAAKQLVPAVVKVVGKNEGFWTGEWGQYSGEGLIEEILASSGFKVGYQRRDFLGKPITGDRFRGLDPTNTKPNAVRDDEVYKEFEALNLASSLALVIGKPTGILNKGDWAKLGLKNSVTDELSEAFLGFSGGIPSLTDMKTTDGRDAYEFYVSMVYEGALTKDLSKKVTGFPVTITIQSGENFEKALRRIIRLDAYTDLTPDAREGVWKTLLGVFKKDAKKQLKSKLVVPKDLFDGGQYGTSFQEDPTFSDAAVAAKEDIDFVNTTKGSPLDEAFAIFK